MEFLIDIGNKKALENLLKKPPVMRQKLLYLRYVGGAFAAAIRNRVQNHGIASDGARIPKFSNSGGMWEGFASRIKGSQAVLNFQRYSYPSAYAMIAQKSFKDEASRKKYLSKLKKRGSTRKIKNSIKAMVSHESKDLKNRTLVMPSRDEINAVLTWMQEHYEHNLPDFTADYFTSRAMPDRFNKMFKHLPHPQNGR